MQGVRQAASGLIYALISVVLVLGSLAVAVAERNAVSAPAPTASARPAATLASTVTAAATATPSQVPATLPSTSTSAPSPAHVSTTALSYPSLAPTRRPATATRPVTITCGPFAGWVKAYVVQSGDTLFHIATLYSTTVTNLQRANCKTGNVIYVGEWLWVPNVATATAGVTIIPPFFDTPTDESTPVLVTETPPYFTPTSAVTETSTSSTP